MKINLSRTPFWIGLFLNRLVPVMAVAMVLACVLGLANPAHAAPTEIKWTEEVQLHDGKIIQLKRRLELTGYSFLAPNRRGVAKYYEFCYAPMAIYWKSKPEYKPETFDIVEGRAYAKVTITGCFECASHGYPETNALYFVWAAGAWKKIDHAEYPEGLRLNLLLSSYVGDDGTKDARGLVTLAEKEKRDYNTYYLMKRTGVTGRNELPQIKNSCEKCKSIRLSGDPLSSEVFFQSSNKNCE